MCDEEKITRWAREGLTRREFGVLGATAAGWCVKATQIARTDCLARWTPACLSRLRRMTMLKHRKRKTHCARPLRLPDAMRRLKSLPVTTVGACPIAPPIPKRKRNEPGPSCLTSMSVHSRANWSKPLHYSNSTEHMEYSPGAKPVRSCERRFDCIINTLKEPSPLSPVPAV